MANNGDELGVDILCTTDFPLRMTLVYGNDNVKAACIRRLNCDEGALASIGDDANYGYNLAAQLNNDFGPGDLAAIGSRVRAELEKDDRVQRARALVMTSSE
jgi:hypothetical protein